MKIIAFLQNQWLRDPARARAFRAKYGRTAYRRFIARALFAGCATGRRLRDLFGSELCGRIVWDNASPQITATPTATVRPDVEYICDAIQETGALVVLGFGTIASDGIRYALDRLPTEPELTVFLMPHPAARRREDQERLEAMAAVVVRTCESARSAESVAERTRR